MQAYSKDLRERVLRGLERGERPTEIARRLEVSRVWVYLVRDSFQQDGRRESLPMGGARVSRVAPYEAQIRSWISAKPELTLQELCQRLDQEFSVQIKGPALWHQLNKWDLSFKKNSGRGRAAKTRRCAAQS